MSRIRWADEKAPRPVAQIEPTREQEAALEALCLEHGTCATQMYRWSCGVFMHVATEDGTFAIDEDGGIQ